MWRVSYFQGVSGIFKNRTSNQSAYGGYSQNISGQKKDLHRGIWTISGKAQILKSSVSKKKI